MTGPNIIVFVADDLGWGDTGSYGATRIPTPAIDALAAGGVRFTDAHASSAVCTPSRYSLVTGRYPWRSPLQAGVLGGTDPSIIAPGQQTIARLARDAGYSTGAFGKWHLGMDWTDRDGRRRSAFDDDAFEAQMQASGREIDYARPARSGPVDHGFDRFFGIAGSLDMPPYCFIDQDHTVGVPDREKSPLITSQRPGLQVEGWRDDEVDVRFTREAQAWIRARADADEPFLAYIASAAPHRPCTPPAFVRGRSQAGDRGDSVCLVDWMLGEILATLEESGVLDDTIVLFTSDNGAPMIFPEDGDVTEHRPNGTWRGQKADAWEGGHRVPLIVSGPGVPGGVVRHETVSLLDVLPTAGELMGVEQTGADGTSLVGLLTSEAVDRPRRVLGHQAYDGALILRDAEKKAIFSSGSGGFSDPVGLPVSAASTDGQFYDLDGDPAEQANLWDGERESAASMLDRFRRATGFDGELENGVAPRQTRRSTSA